MQKKKKEKKENSERWLLTYSDLITLLMILFILLFAMSNVNQEKYDKLSESLKESLGDSTILEGSSGVIDLNGGTTGSGSGTETTPQPTEAATAAPTQVPPKVTEAPDESQGDGQTGEPAGTISTEKGMENLQYYIQDIIKNLKISDYVGTSIKKDGMFITFSNDVFFDSGEDILKTDMLDGIDKLAILLNRIDNSIIIEGHTDNVPMKSNSKFSSNWQLSAARAANVAQYLVDKCGIDGARLTAAGYGEYHPTASNKTGAGRSKNRRIDIVILYN